MKEKQDGASPPAKAPVRRHRGDIMSVEKRSAVMSTIRGKDTKPELAVAAELRRLRLKFDCQARDLPGRPDFVFRRTRVAVFVDGDFWHGFDFERWRDKLSEKWEQKISDNRRRDGQNAARLTDLNWKVLRFWENEIAADVTACAQTVRLAVRERRTAKGRRLKE